MYVVMNVVSVKEENAEAFEAQFLNRESHLHKADGFAGFELLRRDCEGEYIVLSRWESKEDYEAWRHGELFKLSHRHANGELAFNSRVRNYEVVDALQPVG